MVKVIIDGSDIEFDALCRELHEVLYAVSEVTFYSSSGSSVEKLGERYAIENGWKTILCKDKYKMGDVFVVFWDGSCEETHAKINRAAEIGLLVHVVSPIEEIEETLEVNTHDYISIPFDH